MGKIQAKVPVYDEGDAHIVRRLGGAVVAQWDSLPSAVQDLLLEQALFIHDQDETTQLKQQMEQFIERHRGWPKEATR